MTCHVQELTDTFCYIADMLRTPNGRNAPLGLCSHLWLLSLRKNFSTLAIVNDKFAPGKYLIASSAI
jgi:hypothetical protein